MRWPRAARSREPVRSAAVQVWPGVRRAGLQRLSGGAGAGPGAAGAALDVVAARLGHADPAVTLRVYSHVLREHALGMGDIFAPAVNRSS